MTDLERDRRLIDALLRSEKKCRECKHPRFGHFGDRCGAWITKGEIVEMSCKCDDFVPPDNLDYIEWLAKKRGLLE